METNEWQAMRRLIIVIVFIAFVVERDPNTLEFDIDRRAFHVVIGISPTSASGRNQGNHDHDHKTPLARALNNDSSSEQTRRPPLPLPPLIHDMSQQQQQRQQQPPRRRYPRAPGNWMMFPRPLQERRSQAASLVVPQTASSTTTTAAYARCVLSFTAFVAGCAVLAGSVITAAPFRAAQSCLPGWFGVFLSLSHNALQPEPVPTLLKRCRGCRHGSRGRCPGPRKRNGRSCCVPPQNDAAWR